MENNILDTVQMLLAKRDGSIIDIAVEQTAEVVCAGMEYARKNPRKNDNWDIVWAIPVSDDTEIVIGDRHTDFCPYVAWYCYNGSDYRTGDYTQTFGVVFQCALEKVRKELGL